MERLKDKNYQSKLAWRFEDLYRNRVLTDVILCTSDGMALKAHWLILAAYSEIFKQLAISRETTKNDFVGTIVRLEFTSDIVAILLNYCYKGELIITAATKPQVQKAAQLLLMNDILQLLEYKELDDEDEKNPDNTVDATSAELGPATEATLDNPYSQQTETESASKTDMEDGDLKKSGWIDSVKSSASSILKQFSEIVTLQYEAVKLRSRLPASQVPSEGENFKYISLDLSNLESTSSRKNTFAFRNPLLKKRPTIPTRRVVYHKLVIPKIRKSRDTWKPVPSRRMSWRISNRLLNLKILMHCCVTLDSLDTSKRVFLCQKCNKKFFHFSSWKLHYVSKHLNHVFHGITFKKLQANLISRKQKACQKQERKYFNWEMFNVQKEAENDSLSNEYTTKEYDIDNNIQVTFSHPPSTSTFEIPQQSLATVSHVTAVTQSVIPADVQTQFPIANVEISGSYIPQSHQYTGEHPSYTSPSLLPNQTMLSLLQPPMIQSPIQEHEAHAAVNLQTLGPAQCPQAPTSQTSVIQGTLTPATEQILTPVVQSSLSQTDLSMASMVQTSSIQTPVPQTSLMQTPVQQDHVTLTSLPQSQILVPNNVQAGVSVAVQDLAQAPPLTGTSMVSPVPPVQGLSSGSSIIALPVTTSAAVVPSTYPSSSQPLSTISMTKGETVSATNTSSQWLPSHESWMSFLQSDSFTASVLGPPPPQQQNTQYITMVKCSVKGCTFAGYSTRAVNKHMHETHLSLECSYCMFACSEKDELEKHIAERHERKKIRQFACSACNKKFSKAIHHRTHEQSHHGINHNMKEYKCEVEGCQFMTLAKHNYLKHKMTHKDKMYSCQYCGIKIRTMEYLQRHINKQHLNIRPFQCEHCGSAFGDMHALKSHISAVHVKKKEFKCEHCSYAANIRYKVATHMYQVHGIRASFDKRKEIKCPHCNYTALVKSWMTKHMDRHATSKNYTCDLCGKTFGSPRNLNSHTRWAHKTAKHQCSHCEYITKTPTRLKNHIKTQHMFRGYKPYTCPYCPFKCATGGNCRKHVMQKHPGENVTYNRNEELIAYMKNSTHSEDDQPYSQIVSSM